MYCRNCGKKLPDNARFCSECGTVVLVDGKPIHESAVHSFGRRKGLNVTSNFDSRDIEKHKDTSYLCYISVFALIPAFTQSEDSKYIRFHANQGLALAIVEIICLILAVISKLLSDAFIDSYLFVFVALPALLIFSITTFILTFSFFFTIFGIVQLRSGAAYKIPLLGNWDILGRFYK